MSALISVVIPCHNAAQFLTRCLQSVQQQTIVPHEVLVVDDHSTDSTAQIAESLGAGVVVNGPPRGPSAARNAGVRVAEGEWIAFIDADDEWLPNHLEALVSVAERSGFDLVCSEAVDLASNLNARVTDVSPEWHAMTADELLRENLVVQSAAMVRRSVLLSVGGYDEAFRYSEDFELWLRLATVGVLMARTGAPTCLRRKHDSQVSIAIGRMKGSAWDARLKHGLVSQGAALSSEELARRTAAMRDALLYDLRDAWYFGNPAMKHMLERVADARPEFQEAYQQFRRHNHAWPIARTLGWARMQLRRTPAELD